MGSGIQPKHVFAGRVVSALRVTVAAELPLMAEENRIAVLSPNPPGHIFASTNTPVNPSVDDLWILVDEAANRVRLVSASASVFVDLKGAYRFDGEAWVSVEGYVGRDGQWVLLT